MWKNWELIKKYKHLKGVNEVKNIRVESIVDRLNSPAVVAVEKNIHYNFVTNTSMLLATSD